MFGAAYRSETIPTIDVTTLDAEIGEVALTMHPRSSRGYAFVRGTRQGRTSERKAMIDRGHDLSITQQSKAVGIGRGSVDYLPRPVPTTGLALIRRKDELQLELRFAGRQMLRDLLHEEGIRSATSTSRR